MDDPGDRRVAFFVERIPGQLARIQQLFDRGHGLHAQRIVRIVEVDQAEVIRRDRCPVELEDVRQPGIRDLVEGEQARDVLHRRDAVLLLPFPIVPLLIRHVGIEPTSIGS